LREILNAMFYILRGIPWRMLPPFSAPADRLWLVRDLTGRRCLAIDQSPQGLSVHAVAHAANIRTAMAAYR
jgi:hypothetical protein